MARTINATILALVLTLALASASLASSFGFEVVEGDFNTANYLVTVESADNGGSVSFTFTNTSQDESALTSLYWDFGASSSMFTDPTSWAESSDVDYTGNGDSFLAASPGNLPGGQNVSFLADFGMNPDKAGGSIHNGIGSGESLTVTFALNNSVDYSWLIDAMNNGDIRVGAHIQGLGDNAELSASGMTATPIPGAVWLLGSGLMGMIGLRRRNRTA